MKNFRFSCRHPELVSGSNKQGFTLIELLVVVLIIGILAAVAVPQYQKAVLKSRLVNARISLTALEKAQQEYYLANGEYAEDLSALSVEIPTEIFCRANFFCSIYSWPGIRLEWVWEWDVEDEKHRCIAVENDQTANEVCASFGGRLFRHENGEKFYTLP